eukprot:gene18102-23110_t
MNEPPLASAFSTRACASCLPILGASRKVARSARTAASG